MRRFEKISFDQFKKDIKDDLDLYNDYLMPSRGTKNAAGYDFKAVEGFKIKPGETLVIPTGIKFTCNPDEFLMLAVRSSMGVKYNVRLVNQVGIIDSDYYDNISNEGHIFVKLKNEGEKDYVVNQNDKFAQGIILKYNIVDDEEEVKELREGGYGSTDKEEK